MSVTETRAAALGSVWLCYILQGKVCIETDHGEVVVVVIGDRNKPVAITYHDVGANCELGLGFNELG